MLQKTPALYLQDPIKCTELSLRMFSGNLPDYLFPSYTLPFYLSLFHYSIFKFLSINNAPSRRYATRFSSIGHEGLVGHAPGRGKNLWFKFSFANVVVTILNLGVWWRNKKWCLVWVSPTGWSKTDATSIPAPVALRRWQNVLSPCTQTVPCFITGTVWSITHGESPVRSWRLTRTQSTSWYLCLPFKGVKSVSCISPYQAKSRYTVARWKNLSMHDESSESYVWVLSHIIILLLETWFREAKSQ